MNFYLSAVDDQLRHATDGPSIGIILCERRNAMVVEYALRDSAKPMGVAEYRLSSALPTRLAAELPTVDEFAREFPLMSIVRLRVEIERELRALLLSRGLDTSSVAIARMLQELERNGIVLESTREFEATLRAMNEAAHGLEVDEKSAERTIQAGNRFLEELKRHREV